MPTACVVDLAPGASREGGGRRYYRWSGVLEDKGRAEPPRSPPKSDGREVFPNVVQR